MQGKSSASKATPTLTLLMAAAAAVAFELAQADGALHITSVSVSLTAQALFTLIAVVICRKSHARNSEASPVLVWSLLSAGCVLFVGEVIVRELLQAGWPKEFWFLGLLRNTVLCLAALACWPKFARLSTVLSLFLAVFVSALPTHWIVQVLMIVYAVVGIWWLMGSYWEALEGHIVGSTQRRLSRRWLVLPAGIAIASAGLLFGARHSTIALWGFMPTSGGNQGYDPNGRRGVNDGDALVSGADDPRSFGPVESDSFVESTQPSLYDALADTYGGPIKRNKRMEKAISLPMGLVKNVEQRMAQSKQAGREFNSVRKQPQQNRRELADRSGPALISVVGRTPLHLRLEVFDVFDGREWYPESSPTHSCLLEIEAQQGKPWLLTRTRSRLDLLGPEDHHEVKVISLNTNRLPTPGVLDALHIDRVDRKDFFAWAQDSIICMTRPKLPELLVTHVRSRAANPKKLTQSFELGVHGTSQYRQLPTDAGTQRVAELAKSWVADVPSGWPQVHRVIEKLRSEYQVDDQATAPADCLNTVDYFLFHSRRGPDYLFASTATMMLRSLGYSTRLVSGFYAAPESYDRRSRQTPVLASDAHFWPEVFVGSDTWLPVEPTPGYSVLTPPPTFKERVIATLVAFGDWLARHCLLLSVTLATLIAAWRCRVILLDRLLTWRAILFPGHPDRAAILRAFALLNRRFRAAGVPLIAAGSPVRQLRAHMSGVAPRERGRLDELLSLAEWAAFAPASGVTSRACDGRKVREICRTAIETWPLSRWKAIAAARMPQTSISLAQRLSKRFAALRQRFLRTSTQATP